MTSPEVIAELKRIADEADGLLSPQDVVAAARPKSSPLHGAFCWDDTEAANKYRLWQARMLIRTTVQYLEVSGDKTPVRVFVSLTTDRDEEEGGYREVLSVLSDAGHRNQMLSDALEELEVFERKYKLLTELAGVFAASRKVRRNAVKSRVETRELAAV